VIEADEEGKFIVVKDIIIDEMEHGV